MALEKHMHFPYFVAVGFACSRQLLGLIRIVELALAAHRWSVVVPIS
jgi:hypothetical protein